MKSRTVTPYLFEESTIRAVEKDGEPWFVAKDVCLPLGLSNTSMAVKGNAKSGAVGLDADEMDIMILDTLGGPQDVTIVNESGLYALIFKSRKPEARRFRKWVTSEVLPAIRRTGTYGTHHQAFLSCVKDLISLGVDPNVAAKTSIALAPGRKEIEAEAAAVHPLYSETDDVIGRMEPGRQYTLGEIASLLPANHSIVLGRTRPSIASSLGKLLERARLQDKVNVLRRRQPLFTRVADIIPIAHGR